MDTRYENGYEDIDPANAESRIYWDSCPEFEEVRRECMADKDNWLRENYSKDNLVIEDHRGFVVSYRKDTGEPMGMGGVYASGLWDQHTARILNRMYVFPKYRQHGMKGLGLGWNHVSEHIINPLMDANDYKLYLISMQDRGRPRHTFFKAMVKSFQSSISGWTEEEDMLIKSCYQDVKQCYQYFMYHECEEGYYDNWKNKPIITKDDWSALPLGR